MPLCLIILLHQVFKEKSTCKTELNYGPTEATRVMLDYSKS